MNSEDQSQDNSGRKPFLRLAIILVLVAISLVAQYVAFYHVLTRALPANETGGFRYIHWEFSNNLASHYKKNSDEANELSENIHSFFSGEDMKDLVKYLADYSSLIRELKSNETRYRELVENRAELADTYSGRVNSNINAVNSATKSRETLVRHYNSVVSEYNGLIGINRRSAIRVYGSEIRYEKEKKRLEESIQRLKERIENPSKSNISQGLGHIGEQVANNISEMSALRSRISAQNRDRAKLERGIWQEWGDLAVTLKIIEGKWGDLEKHHKVIGQKLNLMEIQDADTKKLHAKFLGHNNATIAFFNETKFKWAELRDLVVQEESSDPRDVDERKLVDTYWLKGQNALRGQMSLKDNNQVEWLHDNGKRTALGVWRKSEDGQVMASFGAGYYIFNVEENGNLTLVERVVNRQRLSLSPENQETYRPPEATTREREKKFTMMAQAGSTAQEFLSEFESLY